MHNSVTGSLTAIIAIHRRSSKRERLISSPAAAAHRRRLAMSMVGLSRRSFPSSASEDTAPHKRTWRRAGAGIRHSSEPDLDVGAAETGGVNIVRDSGDGLKLCL